MKKVLSVCLVLFLFLAIAGCGQSASSTDGKTGSSTAEGTASSSGTAAIGTPDAPVDVKIIIKDVLPDEEDVKLMVTAIEEGMAAQGNYVKLEFLEAPAGGSYTEVVPLAIRTGQLQPDIAYFQSGAEYELAMEGLLADLTSYVNNSTYLKEVYEEYNWKRLENYPYLIYPAPPFTYTANMRSDWFNSLAIKDEFLKNPTVDNFYALLKEIKDKGLAQYPLTTDGNKLRLDGFMNQAFGISTSVMKVDGKWVFAEVTEGTRDKLEFLAKLYADGLMDPEFVTNTWDVMEQRYYEGVSAIIGGRVGSTIKIYEDKMTATNGEEASLVILPPLTGVGSGYAASDVTREPRGFSILEDSPVKDAAFAVLDFMASPEGRTIDKLGILGVHHVEENGKTVTTDKLAEWWSRFYETNNNFEPTPALSEPLFAPPVVDSIDMALKYYNEDINIITPSELAAQKDAMVNLYNEYYVDIITGKKPISAFDDFVKEWNAAGGDQFSEYMAELLG